MSDSSRLQINRYISSLWSDYRESIAKDRKITIEELNEIANNFQIQNINDAVKYKLIDKAIYRDEVLKIIANKINFFSEI